MKATDRKLYWALCLNCDPGSPDTWPESVIHELMNIEDDQGREAALRQLARMLSY